MPRFLSLMPCMCLPGCGLADASPTLLHTLHEPAWLLLTRRRAFFMWPCMYLLGNGLVDASLPYLMPCTCLLGCCLAGALPSILAASRVLA